jgi:hypothetical protein
MNSNGNLSDVNQSYLPRTAKEIATSVYRQVWHEFHEWNTAECRRLNASVARDVTFLKFPAAPVEDLVHALSSIDIVVRMSIDGSAFIGLSVFSVDSTKSNPTRTFGRKLHVRILRTYEQKFV